jgi:hypothetical protein
VSAKKRSLGGVDFVNASVKCKLVVNVNASAFVVGADNALANGIVDLASGRDKNVTVDTSKVRVGLCVSNSNFELGSHDQSSQTGCVAAVSAVASFPLAGVGARSMFI